MNPQEINRRIAIACKLDVVDDPNPKDRPEAWKTAYFTERSAATRRKSWPSSAVVKVVPNYHGDLNAMHEVENGLEGDLCADYTEYLHRVVNATMGSMNHEDMRRFRSATAPQRAEAFLKTLGQWEDDN
jgi:hypothetical protein